MSRIDLSSIPAFSNTTPGHIPPGAMASSLLTQLDGFGRMRRQLRAQGAIKVAECSQLWEQFSKGEISPLLMHEAFNLTEDFAFHKLHKMAPHIFQEAMSTSDFANLTTFVMDRIMMENYPTVPSTFDQIAFLNRNIKDFRTVERWVTDNGEGVWQPVQELEGFQRIKEDTGKYTYKVAKFEKGAQVSWEAMINDDMGQFTDLPIRLATGGKRTIEQFFLSLIAGATGPKSSFYGTAISLPTGGTINNIINLSSYGSTNNPVLNAQNLILAVGLFMNLMTTEGRPIDVASDQLNVLVADGVLFQTLKMIINTNQIASTILGGSKASGAVSPDVTLMAKNWLSGNINPVYAPELRNIMTSNAATAWWLFAKPRRSRPAIEIGFMPGYDSPQMYRKLPDTVRISGGSVEEFGDFETMATEIKGLVIVGGTTMDPRMTMASTGVGS